MARVGRLSGALVVHTGTQYFLVGHTKVPCDWAAAGFEPPGDTSVRSYMPLCPLRAVAIAQPYLTFELEGEALAQLLADRLLVARTGSVSERLWRLVTNQVDDAPRAPKDVTDARWLAEIPLPIWRIVGDTVLRCS
jgi:hypothetical protein